MLTGEKVRRPSATPPAHHWHGGERELTAAERRSSEKLRERRLARRIAKLHQAKVNAPIDRDQLIARGCIVPATQSPVTNQ